MNKGIIIIGLIAGAFLLLKSKGSGVAAAALSGPTNGLPGNLSSGLLPGGAGKTPSAADLAAQKEGYASAADKIAIENAEVALSREALKSNTYVGATKATVAAGVSTAFEIANSGLGGAAAVGGTITVKGADGTKTLINTGSSGYAVLDSALNNALKVVQPSNIAAIEQAAVDYGFTTRERLDAMPADEKKVYLATVVANNPSITPETSAAMAQRNAASQAAAEVSYAHDVVAKVVIPVNLSGTDLTATMTEVGMSQKQLATYNSMIAQGYTEFQAGDQATAWGSNMTAAEIQAAQREAVMNNPIYAGYEYLFA